MAGNETGAKAQTEKPPKQEKPVKPVEKVEKTDHANIFAALAAFQSENPEIKKTKEFGKEGEKMHWWYAPLDELLITVRPLTSRHGLSFTWEGTKDGMVAALYHETYSSEESRITEKYTVDGKVAEVEYGVREKNVLRSMPVKVKREGDMKQIGSDSTYARRYTLAELLGIAPDEDKDAGFEEASKERAQGAMYERVEKGITNAKSAKELDASEKVIAQNLADVKAGKVANLGLKEDQLIELGALIRTQREKLVGKGAPGENHDAGGDAAVEEGNGTVPGIA